MKTKHLPTILALSILITTIAMSTYSLMHALGARANLEPDPEITLTLEGTTTTYKVRDLPLQGGELIIPSSDNSSPTFTYNPADGVITLTSSPSDYKILRADINPYLHHPVPSVQQVSPPYTLVPRYASRVEMYNKRLNNVYRHELIIKLKNGSTDIDFGLPPTLIRQVIMPTSLDLSIPLGIDEPVLLNYILPRLTPTQKEYFNLNATTANVKAALSDRLRLQSTPTVLGVDDGPTSDGKLAPKYLEVDLSQQKMYMFIGGNLHKSYRISTGLDYPTPVGEFHIMNKAPLAFSGIYNVWMPYWMAFKYAGDVGAYLGFHEIAYARIERGKKIYNHDLAIGDKLTGGCVALSPADAKEVYTMSDVGMLVRIVP